MRLVRKFREVVDIGLHKAKKFSNWLEEKIEEGGLNREIDRTILEDLAEKIVLVGGFIELMERAHLTRIGAIKHNLQVAQNESLPIPQRKEAVEVAIVQLNKIAFSAIETFLESNESLSDPLDLLQAFEPFLEEMAGEYSEG